jgi:hypothetical protein
MWRRIFLAGLLILFAGLPFHVGAQSTARGEIVSYNETSRSAVLDLDESDLRFAQIETTGGILSVSVAGVTKEAYLLPNEQDGGDVVNTLRLMGFDPDVDGVSLLIVVARQNSVLRHLDGVSNPLRTLDAAVGDEIRVDAVAPLPTPHQRELDTLVTGMSDIGDLSLDLLQADAAAAGLFPGVLGTLNIGGLDQPFQFVMPADYRFADPHDSVFYLVPSETDAFVQVLPAPAFRNTTNIAEDYGIPIGALLHVTYRGFDYGDTAAGRIIDIQGDGQQLITEIPASYLDDIQAGLGAYVVVSVNGIIRAAMVMDEVMFADALNLGGLTSNYVILRQSGSIKLIYMLEDGRSAQGIFNAEIGSQVRLRPAQAIETIVRPEAVVKAVVEVDPDGYLYTDITPFELSFLEVLVGQHVDVRINGITYRSLLVDSSGVGLLYEDEDILVFPSGDHTIITQPADNTLTAESRFQVSVGDVVVIERAPN